MHWTFLLLLLFETKQNEATNKENLFPCTKHILRILCHIKEIEKCV